MNISRWLTAMIAAACFGGTSVPGWLGLSRVHAQYTLQSAKTPPPKEFKEAIGALLDKESARLLDANGKLIAEVWLRKEITAMATPEKVKKGLSYRELPETALLGAIRVSQPIIDFRKQTIKPGVYSLRLGIQPMDGDHMGTAPHNEFFLMVPAADEKDTAEMQSKDLNELSTKASGTGHPAVLLLYPNPKPAEAARLIDKGDNTWVLQGKISVKIGEKTIPLGVGLTLVGVSPSAS